MRKNKDLTPDLFAKAIAAGQMPEGYMSLQDFAKEMVKRRPGTVYSFWYHRAIERGGVPKEDQRRAYGRIFVPTRYTDLLATVPGSQHRHRRLKVDIVVPLAAWARECPEDAMRGHSAADLAKVLNVRHGFELGRVQVSQELAVTRTAFLLDSDVSVTTKNGHGPTRFFFEALPRRPLQCECGAVDFLRAPLVHGCRKCGREWRRGDAPGVRGDWVLVFEPSPEEAPVHVPGVEKPAGVKDIDPLRPPEFGTVTVPPECEAKDRDLDEFGAALDLPREPSEPDAEYRTRLVEKVGGLKIGIGLRTPGHGVGGDLAAAMNMPDSELVGFGEGIGIRPRGANETTATFRGRIAGHVLQMLTSHSPETATQVSAAASLAGIERALWALVKMKQADRDVAAAGEAARVQARGGK